MCCRAPLARGNGSSGSGFWRRIPNPIPYQLLFGLGELSEVEEVLVAWPSGATLRLKHPEVDRYHRLNQQVGSSGEY